MTKHILIAGTQSGVGKTTLTMGLIAALARRGLRVQPFKVGPDYIDPTYHTLAAGRACRNFDTWMVPPKQAVAMYRRAAQDADAVVIEGVMGLFDGASYTEETGSSAEIAKLVGAPVLLVLDVGKMARSAGALAAGYRQFDPRLNIAGFIANRCGSERHFQGVKAAIETATGVPVVGWLPKDTDLHIPERHLGLIPTDERGELTDFIAHAATLFERYFDVEKILALMGKVSVNADELSGTEPQIAKCQSPVTIAVARDAAFSFYYEDNLDLLRAAGAEIVFFSPLTDPHLPPHTTGIYLGGGFPELYAAQLAQNTSLLADLQRVRALGMPIYAECGGFMYLTGTLLELHGDAHRLAGLIPGFTRMQPKLAGLGYRLVEGTAENFLLPAGAAARGHEFHWSTWDVTPTKVSPAWIVRSRRNPAQSSPAGYAHRNLVASYLHLHFAGNLQLACNFVTACQRPMTKACPE